jgi:hypothetical protein
MNVNHIGSRLVGDITSYKTCGELIVVDIQVNVLMQSNAR